mmetsp:Transcript_25139/g.58386  ORF Transcript_25139/g.58386 Transcript_25139/m.58386 type:complete len:88 (+) Transcript_25139:1981-2244(+)
MHAQCEGGQVLGNVKGALLTLSTVQKHTLCDASKRGGMQGDYTTPRKHDLQATFRFLSTLQSWQQPAPFLATLQRIGGSAATASAAA